MQNSREKLFEMIVSEVYQEGLANGTGWLMDFKSHILRKDFLELYSEFFFDMLRKEGFSEVQVGGIESSALPIIAGLHIFDTSGIIKNTFYIRKSRKKSGLSKNIEGELLPNIPIILVDDILNSGRSLLKQLSVIDGPVAGVFAALRFRSKTYYESFKTPIFSIFDLDDFSNHIPLKNLVDEGGIILANKYQIETSRKFSDKIDYTLVVAKSSPVLSGDYLYISSDDGVISCMNTLDGKTVWEYRIPFGADKKIILSTPVIYKDFILFGAYDGTFYCLQRFTGRVAWRYMEADWIGSSPCFAEKAGIVYVGLEFGLFRKQGGLVAIHIDSGKILWKNLNVSSEMIHASPVINEKIGILACGSNDGIFRAFDMKTGKELWKFQTQAEIKHGAVFDENRKLVMFGSFDGKFYILKVGDGSEWASFEAGAGFYSSPVINSDNVIIGSLDKHIYAYDFTQKVMSWKIHTNGRIFSSPLIFENSCYIGSNDGMLYEIDVSTGNPLSLTQFPERIMTQVQVERIDSGKRVYVFTQDNVLYRLAQVPIDQ